jgi:hypothetical protein
MRFKDSMHDGDVLAWNVINGDIADFIPSVRGVDEEEEVPTVKCWLHRAAEWGSRGQTHQHSWAEGVEIRGQRT